MSMIDDIKHDIENDPEAEKGWKSSVAIWDEDTNEVACVLTGRLCAISSVSRRVNRVKDMEAALLAAEDLADASDAVIALDENTSLFGGEMQSDRIERTHDRFRAALKAYREAMS